MKSDVAHETLGFILVWGVVHAKPYSSGAAALLVFVCSITGTVAPSYEVDWNEEMGVIVNVPITRSLPPPLYIARGVGL